jgi:hypothetical protein
MKWTEGIALAALLLPTAAQAQGRDDDPTRRRLILEAGALRDRGDHAAALERLRQAAARRMSPSLRLFLAQEERAVGRYDDAIRDARGCAQEFESDRTLSHRGEFLTSCRALVDELATRVGRVIVRVPADVRDASVTLRGAPFPAESWGVAWDVLPGPLAVEVTARGRETFTRQITVQAGSTAFVRAELPPRVAPTAPDRPPPFVPPREVTSTGVPVGPVVLLGLGGATLALSAVFFALRGGALDTRDGLCGTATGDCLVATPELAREAMAAQDDASTYNTLSAVTLGVGAAAAGAGLIWLLVAPRSRAPSRTAVSLAPYGGGASLTLQHAW